jgi:hypothetical protein
VQDAASATTPNATTQIRLTTADLPAPTTASQRCSPNWDEGSSCSFRVPSRENISQVRLLHGLAKIGAQSTLGPFLRSFTRGDVCLAEGMTGHPGHGKHDPGGAGSG